jgi:hypothetical protein
MARFWELHSFRRWQDGNNFNFGCGIEIDSTFHFFNRLLICWFKKKMDRHSSLIQSNFTIILIIRFVTWSKRQADTVRRNLPESLTKPRNTDNDNVQKGTFMSKEHMLWLEGKNRAVCGIPSPDCDDGKMWGIQRERDPARHKRTCWELHTRT